jgi:GTP cyclohydrolase II
MNPTSDLNFTDWCVLPTPMGDFRMYDSGDDLVRVVSLGDLLEQGEQPLVRVHSSCLASEVFAARDCDCADQLRESMKLIATEGRGIILHLHQEGRGHGLSLKIKAVGEMQRGGVDTVAAFESLGLEQDIRSYEDVVWVLRALDITAVRLITNNPRKVRFLESAGIRAEMVNTHPVVRAENRDYLATKKAKLGHQLPLVDDDETTSLPIHFYHSDQPWGALSNFSPHAIFLDDRVWPTVEHYYQARKFTGTTHEEAIRTSDTPMLAKRRAQELARESRRADWDAVKEQVMLDGLRAKFSQHPDLRVLLIRTGDRALVEHTENDVYWGDGGDGRGENRLGQLLMAVRAELRQQKQLTVFERGG